MFNIYAARFIALSLNTNFKNSSVRFYIAFLIYISLLRIYVTDMILLRRNNLGTIFIPKSRDYFNMTSSLLTITEFTYIRSLNKTDFVRFTMIHKRNRQLNRKTCPECFIESRQDNFKTHQV